MQPFDEFDDSAFWPAVANSDRRKLAGQLRKKSTSITSNVSAQPVQTVPEANAQATGSDRPVPMSTSADWYGKGLDELERPADYSAAQESQRQNVAAANRAMMMALAAHEAGPEFQTMSRHFLGRSKVDPLKLAGAVIDERGQLVTDPAFQRTRRGELYMKRGDVAAGQERARAEAAARAEEKAADRALRLALAQSRPSQEPMVQVQMPDGSIVYTPRSQAAGMAPPKKAGHKLADTAIKDLASLEGDAATLDRLEQSYRPEYGPNVPVPGAGRLKQKAGALFGTDASNWYSRYQDYFNITLKRLSGAAVTASEAERFEAAMISPDTPASEVPRRLAQQREAVISARNRLLENYGQAGYDTGTLQVAPVPAAPAPGARVGAAQPQPLSGGWTVRVKGQ